MKKDDKFLCRPSDASIQVRNLGKKYQLYDSPTQRLKEALHPFRKKYHNDFWALRGVSFEVEPGEAFGIIGVNGSGKSTLLKMIAGVLMPAEGDVFVKGRVSALLELGAGFNPNYTGIQNINFHAALHEWPPEGMDARLRAIISFADIGEFIEYPVKTYSSGMFLRLAFACAVHGDSNILVIDEALAVGDVFFRQKCYARLRELRERGVIILLVSHAMPDVQQFCQRVLLLHKGNVLFCGDSSEGIKKYYLLLQEQSGFQPSEKLQETAPNADRIVARAVDQEDRRWPASDAFSAPAEETQVSNGWAKCTGIAVCNSEGAPCSAYAYGETVSFFYEFVLSRSIDVPVGGLMLRTDKGVNVHGKTTLLYEEDFPTSADAGNTIRFRQDVQLNIAPGEYIFDIGLVMLSKEDYSCIDGFPYHELLSDRGVRLCHIANAGNITVLRPGSGIPRNTLHHGLVNLPGQGEAWLATSADFQAPTQNPASCPRAKILINSIPKSGTHLLKRCLSLFPGVQFSGVHVDLSLTQEEIIAGLKSVSPGSFATGHLPYDERIRAACRELNYVVLLLVRDPRDRAVSHAKYVARTEEHFLHGRYSLLTEEQRLTSSIEGVSGDHGRQLQNIDSYVRSFLGWKETEETCTVFFENLIGARGGGTAAAQRDEILKIASHIHVHLSEEDVCRIAEHVFDTASATFRKGQIGDWRNHFSKEHIRLFKRVAGDLLVDLGYERDNSW